MDVFEENRKNFIIKTLVSNYDIIDLIIVNFDDKNDYLAFCTLSKIVWNHIKKYLGYTI